MLFATHADRKTSPITLAASLAIHLAAVVLLIHRPEPPLIQQSLSLRGNGGGSRVMAIGAARLVPPSFSTAQPEIRNHQFRRHSKRRQVPAEAPSPASGKALSPGMPGFVLGSLTEGIAGDHDVRVAISVVAPPPPIARAQLPNWINGDVIVEVTIDDQGNVVQTRVLQTVGFGLDEIIVETLRRWHYLPAKIDGMPVASRQDVHFHFPS